MGKISFTPIQQLVFDEFSKNEVLRNNFYFTGGTALSMFYLQHRLSDDLDFFCETDIKEETSFAIDELMKKISILLKINHRFTLLEKTRIFEFEKDEKLLIKVDFASYPYNRLEKGRIYNGVVIDSLFDIATNKLLTICQRNDVKDFVDLYFLNKKFTLWDLIHAVEKKFSREIDILLLGTEFLKVENFDYLPKMTASLELPELKEFFKEKAREVAKRVVV